MKYYYNNINNITVSNNYIPVVFNDVSNGLWRIAIVARFNLYNGGSSEDASLILTKHSHIYRVSGVDIAFGLFNLSPSESRQHVVYMKPTLFDFSGPLELTVHVEGDPVEEVSGSVEVDIYAQLIG